MGAESAWWQTFFSGLVLESYRWWTSEQQTRDEADFIAQVLSPAAGAQIADVPCGNGRLALALAARGLRVTGVDITAGFLEAARRAATERGLTARFEQRDMRDLPWPAEYDHAFCFGNSFGYLDEAGNRAFLQAIHRILRPGGRFLLETRFAAESILLQPLQPRWYPLGDLFLLHQTQYDPATTQLTSSYIHIKNGQVERKQAVYQVYTCRELQRVFHEVGFAQLESYGSLEREPFRLGSPGLWIVATKA